MENIYDEKELEEYYDAFKLETEHFIEEIFRKGFDKGMERVWEYLNCAASLNSDKYEKLFGPREITDILREFTPIVFINTMDTINASGLIKASKLIKQYTAPKNDHDDPNNIDEEYEAGINDLWNKIKEHNQTGNTLYYSQLDYVLYKSCISNFYKYEKEKCSGLYAQGVIDLYESLETISKFSRDEAINKISRDDFVNIFGSDSYSIIEKTPEELIQIMKPYLEKKEDNDD